MIHAAPAGVAVQHFPPADRPSCHGCGVTKNIKCDIEISLPIGVAAAITLDYLINKEQNKYISTVT